CAANDGCRLRDFNPAWKGLFARKSQSRALAWSGLDFRGGRHRWLNVRKDKQGTGSNQMKWILLSVVVAATVLRDLLQSYLMKRAGEQPAGARGLLQLRPRISRNRYLIL